LFDVYGKEAAQTFTTNHALQIVFPPKASELVNFSLFAVTSRALA